MNNTQLSHIITPSGGKKDKSWPYPMLFEIKSQLTEITMPPFPLPYQSDTLDSVPDDSNVFLLYAHSSDSQTGCYGSPRRLSCCFCFRAVQSKFGWVWLTKLAPYSPGHRELLFSNLKETNPPHHQDWLMKFNCIKLAAMVTKTKLSFISFTILGSYCNGVTIMPCPYEFNGRT